jgi:hypothetical protein
MPEEEIYRRESLEGMPIAANGGGKMGRRVQGHMRRNSSNVSQS